MVTIATGQVAGNSKDGKVNLAMLQALGFWKLACLVSTLCVISGCLAPPSSCSRLGLRDPQHASRYRDGSVWQSGHMRGFLQVGKKIIRLEILRCEPAHK